MAGQPRPRLSFNLRALTLTPPYPASMQRSADRKLKRGVVRCVRRRVSHRLSGQSMPRFLPRLFPKVLVKASRATAEMVKGCRRARDRPPPVRHGRAAGAGRVRHQSAAGSAEPREHDVRPGGRRALPGGRGGPLRGGPQVAAAGGSGPGRLRARHHRGRYQRALPLPHRPQRHGDPLRRGRRQAGLFVPRLGHHQAQGEVAPLDAHRQYGAPPARALWALPGRPAGRRDQSPRPARALSL